MIFKKELTIEQAQSVLSYVSHVRIDTGLLETVELFERAVTLSKQLSKK